MWVLCTITPWHGHQAVAERCPGHHWAPRGDDVHRLAPGRARTHQLEEMARLAARAKSSVSEEQVLVQPARHQRSRAPGRIREAPPTARPAAASAALACERLADRPARPRPASAAGSGTPASLKPGDRERACPPWDAGPAKSANSPGSGHWLIAADPHAQLRPAARCWRAAARGHGPARASRHQRRLAALGSSTEWKPLRAPGLLRLRIDEQPGGAPGPGCACRCTPAACWPRAAPSRAAQVELAGRVVTGMAGHAVLGEDRLHIAGCRKPVHGRHCQRRAASRTVRQAPASEAALHHGGIAMLLGT